MQHDELKSASQNLAEIIEKYRTDGVITVRDGFKEDVRAAMDRVNKARVDIGLTPLEIRFQVSR